jgi:hypothetical protein
MVYTGSVVQRGLPVQLGRSKHLPMVLQWQWYIMEEVNLEKMKPGHMHGHDGNSSNIYIASTGASGKKVVNYVKPPNSLFDTWPSEYRSSNGSAVTEMYSM